MPASAPSARVPIPREIWVLICAAFAIAVGFGLVSPVLPVYAKSFDVGVAAATVVVSIFAFFRLIFAPAGGVLVERLGERRIYLSGLIIVAISSLATAFAANYWQLLIYRGLGGIGSTMFTISSMALIVRLAPPSARGRVSSVYATAFLIGSMIGPVIGGVLAEWGLRVPFIVYAVALFIAAAVVKIGLGGARLRPPTADSSARPVLTVGEALRNPSYRAVLMSGVANGWVNFGARVAVLPLLAASILGSPWVAGAALAIGAVGTAATLQFSGRLADTIGRRPLILAGLVILGLTFGLIGLADHAGLSTTVALSILFGLCLLSGVGAGLIGPATQAAVADIIGNDRNGGKVLAVFQMAQDTGTILGPILIGLVVDAAGFELAFALCGLIALIGALPWIRAPETVVLQPQETKGQ
ncbi:MAG: MFS transporter [Ornithinimicrobium sp.]|uniref:MFS transporter n=1 Tax=Ornithinimicrobium sp. TaxID=1977084 RepID=UPI0026E0E009|nr:MFS transporter [Ornithinimicrobium sp.]MDO5740608.1 MFS transporter [Ornithinimicrobium sp.]